MSARAGGKQPAACCGGQAVRLQNKVRDPLCGAAVTADSHHKLNHQGRGHRFCSEACREDYAHALQGEAVPGVTFECVMHPELRQELPGECAMCGMTLGPVRVKIGGRSPFGGHL
ncbi:MAG: heavy metal-binding domain-containing protein [bacterium]